MGITFDLFVAKLDPTGAYLWGNTIGTQSGELAGGIAADAAGNMIVVGSLVGSGDFGGGTMTSAGGADVFVAKYDPNGKLLWAKLFGDASDQSARAVAVDAAGNIAVAGVFDGVLDFGGGPIQSMGNGDAFVAKLDPSGNYVWARGFGDAQAQAATSVAFSGSQNLVIGGNFASRIDFGGGPLTAVGGTNVFVAKFLVP